MVLVCPHALTLLHIQPLLTSPQGSRRRALVLKRSGTVVVIQFSVCFTLGGCHTVKKVLIQLYTPAG